MRKTNLPHCGVFCCIFFQDHDWICYLHNLLFEGYKIMYAINLRIRVQTAFIKGAWHDFDISIDNRTCVFLPEVPQKPDNQSYRQLDHFTRDTVSPQILLMLMKGVLVVLVNSCAETSQVNSSEYKCWQDRRGVGRMRQW